MLPKRFSFKSPQTPHRANAMAALEGPERTLREKRDQLYKSLVAEISALRKIIEDHILEKKDEVTLELSQPLPYFAAPHDNSPSPVAGVIEVISGQCSVIMPDDEDEASDLCIALMAALARTEELFDVDHAVDTKVAQDNVELREAKVSLAECRSQLSSCTIELESTLATLQLVQDQASHLDQSSKTITEKLIRDLSDDNVRLRDVLQSLTESYKHEETEKLHWKSEVSKKDDIIAASFVKVDESETRLNSLRAKLDTIVQEHENEMKHLQRFLEASKEELRKEQLDRFDVIEQEKERLDRSWTISLSLEREVKSKAEAAVRDHYEQIIEERNRKVAEMELELNEVKLHLLHEKSERRRSEVTSTKGSRLMTSALESSKKKAADSETALRKVIDTLTADGHSDLLSRDRSTNSTPGKEAVSLQKWSDDGECTNCGLVLSELRLCQEKYDRSVNEHALELKIMKDELRRYIPYILSSGNSFKESMSFLSSFLQGC